MKRSFVLALLCLVLAALAASATTIAYVPLRQSVRMSDVVAVGYVLGMEAVYNREGEIVTRVDVLVEEPLKGAVQPGQVVSFHAWGGSLDGVNVETVGEARYRLGEKVLLQLEDIDGEYHTLGLAFGKWNVVRDKAGSPWITRSLSDLEMVGVTEAPVVQFPLERMRRIAREIERSPF
ncbi:MAG TPA: hypothetical protein VGG03_06870 [Thermoanaerobaculia bacterium]|jgi:hypothetical protein